MLKPSRTEDEDPETQADEIRSAAAGRTADLAARASYSRLLAFLAARTRDVAAAEDALGDAFRAALETWPRTGVPTRPEAWLLAAARNRLADGIRHARVRSDAAADLRLVAEEAGERAAADAFPDERLKLLFLCAHPAIDVAARTPLMLQTVLGLDAARIGSAFLVAPAAMGQRLVRAKTKIRAARIPFTVPERADLAPRLAAVLDAIYVAYGTGWEDAAGADPRRRGLADEAIWLARLVVGLLPAEPEAQGLLSLMLFSESRRAARRTPDGAYVPLSEQDTAAWFRPMIDEADWILSAATDRRPLGRYVLEAAIQSAHTMRRIAGHANWPAVVQLYDRLVAIAPAMGALVGRAAALAEDQGPEIGLTALDRIEAARDYQPYWAVRADLLTRLGRVDVARQAYEKAIGLAEDPAVRAFLQSRRTRLDR